MIIIIFLQHPSLLNKMNPLKTFYIPANLPKVVKNKLKSLGSLCANDLVLMFSREKLIFMMMLNDWEFKIGRYTSFLLNEIEKASEYIYMLFWCHFLDDDATHMVVAMEMLRRLLKFRHVTLFVTYQDEK